MPPSKKRSSSSLSVEVNAVPVLQADDSSDDLPRSGQSRTSPLPRSQLAIIYAIKLVVPIASTQILPYVNKMVAGLDIPKNSSVGYYTGLLGTAHTAGQMLTVFLWGRLSGIGCLLRINEQILINMLDRIGRTPVLAFGMAGLGITTFMFGVSTTFLWALFTRFLSMSARYHMSSRLTL